MCFPVNYHTNIPTFTTSFSFFFFFLLPLVSLNFSALRDSRFVIVVGLSSNGGATCCGFLLFLSFWRSVLETFTSLLLQLPKLFASIPLSPSSISTLFRRFTFSAAIRLFRPKKHDKIYYWNLYPWTRSSDNKLGTERTFCFLAIFRRRRLTLIVGVFFFVFLFVDILFHSFGSLLLAFQKHFL